MNEMNNADFWASVRTIIAEGFTPEGLLRLDRYGESRMSITFSVIKYLLYINCSTFVHY